VVEQITADEKMDEYVKTYTSMQAKNAAAIFDTMTDNLSLVADILNNMGTTQRADILSKMDTDTAAKLTKMMNPSD
jgi:flagellar motility protein MotE (MotC chaperone)